MNYNKKIEELQELETKYHNSYYRKVEIYQEFSNKKVIKNLSSNELFVLKNDVDSYINKTFNSIIQQILYNKSIVKNDGIDYVPYFITFTCPSSFHPFKTIQDKKVLNPNFQFETIEESVDQSYLFLKNIFRKFYKGLKNIRRFKSVSKFIKYNRIFEYHKSFIPHLHLILYVPKEMENEVLGVYNNIIETNGMNLKGNKLIKIDNSQGDYQGLDNIDGVVNYMSKYIVKMMSKIKEDDETKKTFLGWKFHHKIILHYGNNTKIGLKNYDKIYKSLNEEEKENIMEKVKNDNTCLLYEIEKLVDRKIECYRQEDPSEIKENHKIVNDKSIYQTYEKYEIQKRVSIKKIFELIMNVKRLGKSLNDLKSFILVNLDELKYIYYYYSRYGKIDGLRSFFDCLEFEYRYRIEDKRRINKELNKLVEYITRLLNEEEKEDLKELISEINYDYYKTIEHKVFKNGKIIFNSEEWILDDVSKYIINQ